MNNEFHKSEENETENSTNSENKSWIKVAKDSGKWIPLQKDYTMIAKERYARQKESSEPTSKIRQRSEIE